MADLVVEATAAIILNPSRGGFQRNVKKVLEYIERPSIVISLAKKTGTSVATFFAHLSNQSRQPCKPQSQSPILTSSKPMK